MGNKIISGLISLIIILGFFIFFAYLVQSNIVNLEALIGDNFLGAGFYVLILIVAAVFAPVSVLPFVPLASSQWGWPLAGALTLIGESIGAAIVFFIARTYGYPIVRKIVSLENLHKLEKFIPEKHLFIGIIILRVAIPLDVVSYAFGLFSKVKWKTYISASIIGLVPYAFVTAYLGGLPLIYLINFILAGLIIFILIIIIGLKSRKDFRELFSKWWESRFKS